VDVNPFATPESARSPVRRFRGRFAQSVTLWTAPGPAGLTVSSCLIADGEPGRVIGLIDDESELWPAVRRTGVFTVQLLEDAQQQLADRFAGQLPAAGGLFQQGEQWSDTPFGPVTNPTWAGCRLDGAREFGWGLLVEATIEEITLGPGEMPLVHHRGSYRRIAAR